VQVILKRKGGKFVGNVCGSSRSHDKVHRLKMKRFAWEWLSDAFAPCLRASIIAGINASARAVSELGKLFSEFSIDNNLGVTRQCGLCFDGDKAREGRRKIGGRFTEFDGETSGNLREQAAEF
jgi:hypothetical protein